LDPNNEGSPEQPFEFDDDDQALMESPDLNHKSNNSRMRRSDLDIANNGQDDEDDDYGRDAGQEDLYDYFIPVSAGSAQIQSTLS
jgi:hypothetical protein